MERSSEILSDAKVETLEYIFECLEQESKRKLLNKWEIDFMEDQRQRYDQYSQGTRFSPKQWAIIQKIEGVLVEGRR